MMKTERFLIVGILIGIAAGGFFGWRWPDAAKEVGFLGDLFINGLKLLIVPIVVFSMIVGIAALGDVRRIGRVGAKTLLYYFCTTAIAVIIGLVLVNLIRPGELGVRTLDEAQYRAHLDRRIARLEKQRATLGDEPSGKARAVDEALDAWREARESLAPVPARFAADHGAWRFVLSRARSPDHARELALLPVDEGFLTERPAQRELLFTQLAVLSKEEAVEGAYAKVGAAKERSAWETAKEVLMGMVPDNIVKAAVELNVLALILVSLLFGGVLTTLGERGRGALSFFEVCNETVLKMVGVLMLYSPIGIFGLVAGRIGAVGGGDAIFDELSQIGQYALTVIIGLSLHAFVVLPMLLRVFARRSGAAYARAVSPALFTAFSTASSSAALPTTLRCAEVNAGVSNRAASFVLPLGATINMDGTALYEAVAVMFIAQSLGMDLGLMPMIVIFLTATLASIGAAGIPSAGLVTMVMVLQAVKIPTDGIALILMIDWFLDRLRTTVNVWGDSVGAAIIDRGGVGDMDSSSDARALNTAPG